MRFADLIASDGYQVIPNREKFQEKTLKGHQILVIVSALGANRDTNPQEAGNPAFTERECDAVRDWVRRGGSLLLVADHEPTGAAAENLARRGVGLSLKGPAGSTTILKLADTVFDQLESGAKIPATGRAQGVAFKFGKGRVVVIGEAAVISGQATGRPGTNIDRWGRHHPGIDARQFALNIMHWLSGLLN